jgi:hypothetical protein
MIVAETVKLSSVFRSLDGGTLAFDRNLNLLNSANWSMSELINPRTAISLLAVNI